LWPVEARRVRAGGPVVVVGSVVFYRWWNPSVVSLPAGSIGANDAITRLIDAAGQHPRRQHWIAVACVAANIATLGYYKYLDWTISLLNATGLLTLPAPHIAMPLGISLFTFTQIGYLIDCKQGVAKQRGLLNYLLFVTLFPHLIAGPILHNREMMPQFANP
jgi:alginate O-acetyltransferase complex protein AlgI